MKKIFSSTSHENVINNAEEENFLAAEHKFELSEEHRILDDMKSIVQMDSFLRE